MRTLVGVRLPLPGERVLVLDFAERVTDAGRPTHRVGVGFGLVVIFRDLGVFGGDVWVDGWWLVVGDGGRCLVYMFIDVRITESNGGRSTWR